MTEASYSRKVAITLAGVALWVLAGAAPTGAFANSGAFVSKKTKAPKDCQFPRVEPTRIVIGCADFSSYVSHLKWGHWGPNRAGGHGKFQLNDCMPSCVEGTVHHYAARVRLRDPHKTRCNGRRVELFSEMELRFTHRQPPHAERWRQNQLFCERT